MGSWPPRKKKRLYLSSSLAGKVVHIIHFLKIQILIQSVCGSSLDSAFLTICPVILVVWILYSMDYGLCPEQQGMFMLCHVGNILFVDTLLLITITETQL